MKTPSPRAAQAAAIVAAIVGSQCRSDTGMCLACAPEVARCAHCSATLDPDDHLTTTEGLACSRRCAYEMTGEDQ